MHCLKWISRKLRLRANERPKQNHDAYVPVARTEADSAHLIAFIISNYHEPHRAALLQLHELAIRCADAALAEDIAELQHQLELHMFKEEMRAFPMIEQGSSRLLGHLAVDMMKDHVHIEALAGRLRQRIKKLSSLDADPQVIALKELATNFLDELAAHSRLEDEKLFGPLSHQRAL